MDFKKEEILIVFALKPESLGLPEKLGFKTLYTGVGKVNASIALSQCLLSTLDGRKVRWVLNMGSAGSQRLKRGTLVFGDEIKQHDMDVRPLGFELGVTPFDEQPQSYNSYDPGDVFKDVYKGLILTGDKFVTEKLPWQSDAIDMEAYSLAKTSYHLGVKFSSLKYITDGANDDSVKDWPEEVKKAALKFKEILQELNSQLSE